MQTMLVYTGSRLPQRMAEREVHLVYLARGVLARNLYMILKMNNPTTCVTVLVAIVIPWIMK